MPPKGKKGGAQVGRALMRKHAQQGPPTAASKEAEEEGKKHLSSILEMNSLDDFLDTALMAQRDFTAVKERDILILDAKTGGLTSATNTGVFPMGKKNKKGGSSLAFRQLKVPRRPAWHTGMSAAELDRAEKDAFLEWRREIAALEENSGDGDLAKVTPFEKNLEVWRQLWRVLERSHVVVQIVDARDPLFYYSEDLHAYAGEMSIPRQRLILVNKADYLTAGQRQQWAEHFQQRGWQYAFFSARKAQEILTELAREERLRELEEEAEGGEGDDLGEEEEEEEESEDDEDQEEGEAEEVVEEETDTQGVIEDPAAADLDLAAATATESTIRVLTREELIARLKVLAETAAASFPPIPGNENKQQKATIGMVGFPNVGKSSVINVLMGVTALDHDKARVAVSSTPGKTKHFQTLPLDAATMLCDCPGLVFPSFVATTADMVCAGVLPINQLRDHMAPVDLVCQRVPPALLRGYYGLKALDSVDATTSSRSQGVVQTAREFLSDLCETRGYYAQGSGVPDVNRAARMVLKEYVEGRLVYCHPPPGLGVEEATVFVWETQEHLSQGSARMEERLRHLRLIEEAEEEEEEEEGERSGGSDTLREAAEGGAGGEEDEEEEGEVVDYTVTTEGSGRSGKARVKPTKRWGKKGKKMRDKNPYDDKEDAGGERHVIGARVCGRKGVAGGAVEGSEGGVFTRVKMPHKPI